LNGGATGQDRGGNRLLRVALGPVRDALRSTGDLGTVAGGAIRQTPRSWIYFSEVLRQAGILITGSALLIFFMMFMIGTFCGLEGDAMLTSYGAASYTGVYTAWCGIREAGPIMFGYILAAKVGCGLVAEIGSMTISEEIDALEVMGIPASRFILATRLMAAWLVLPPLFIVGISFEQLANFFIVLVQIGNVSAGTFEHVQFVFQSPLDLLYAGLKGFFEGTAIVLVGMWYGIRARGGPAGVGVATAKSMVVNLVLIHVISGVLTRVFWNAYNPNAPIGG
jgi:phospholipid/cholesterol/gamma-HCH transport system permease protein